MEDLRIVAALTDRLSKLELDLDNVMTHAGLAQADSLSHRSLYKVDPDMTFVSERASCYPVRCSLEHADLYLTIRFRQRVAAIQAARVCYTFISLYLWLPCSNATWIAIRTLVDPPRSSVSTTRSRRTSSTPRT